MLRRTRAVVVMTATLIVASGVPALADPGWGSVDCSQNPHPGCDLEAGKGGRSGREVPESEGHGLGPHLRGGRSGGGREGTGERDPNLARCAYERSDYEAPGPVANASFQESADTGAPSAARAVWESEARLSPAGQSADHTPGRKGAWYVYKCSSNGFRDAFYRPPVWIPDAAQEGRVGPVTPSPAQVARRARSQLRLPNVRIRTNPSDEQLVNLPTWLWVARRAWRPVSATASVPGVSVTAVARPSKVVWKLGDGRSVTCRGPGTPYAADARGKRRAWGPGGSSPDCGHTYRSSSAGQPGNAYAVSVTVHWTVSWSGAGESGVFPGMTTTANARFRVAESQALNSEG